MVYELLASVAHIRDAKSGGNLVAHVHVGETYHQRKEGVTTTQHYLFNDFSIVDIEKVRQSYISIIIIHSSQPYLPSLNTGTRIAEQGV